MPFSTDDYVESFDREPPAPMRIMSRFVYVRDVIRSNRIVFHSAAFRSSATISGSYLIEHASIVSAALLHNSFKRTMTWDRVQTALAMHQLPFGLGFLRLARFCALATTRAFISARTRAGSGIASPHQSQSIWSSAPINQLAQRFLYRSRTSTCRLWHLGQATSSLKLFIAIAQPNRLVILICPNSPDRHKLPKALATQINCRAHIQSEGRRLSC